MGANKRAKDAAMAAYMKAKGIVRKSCRCPICHHEVNLNRLAEHLRSACRIK